MSLLQTLNLPPPAKAGAAAKTAAPAAAKKDERLAKASAAWRQTHADADARIKALQQAVKSHCADVPAALLSEIETGLKKLDAVMVTIDHRLADALAAAAGADSDAARRDELKVAKDIFAEYIAYAKGEPLIAHMDQNPFGVKTDLKGLLITGLGKAGTAIG